MTVEVVAAWALVVGSVTAFVVLRHLARLAWRAAKAAAPSVPAALGWCRRLLVRAAFGPPPEPAPERDEADVRLELIRKRYEVRLAALEAADLEPHERDAGKRRAKRLLLKELDDLMKE